MLKRVLLFFVFCLPLLAQAQVATRVLKNDSAFRAPCTGNSAGTINTAASGPASGNQSNNPIFLCGGDSYNIVHNRDYVLKGDGQVTSDSGIVYIIYECRPTVDGPNQTAIEADPCLETDHNAASTIVVSTPTPNAPTGNITITNTGAMQNFFTAGTNGGGGGPIDVYVAPATIDDYTDLSWTTNGSCISVSPSQAIRLVFLNPITTTTDINNCVGSFTISGGYPEYDATEFYQSITIRNTTTNQTIQPSSGGFAPHGGTVTFNANSPAIYEITISDDVSCDHIFQMDMRGCVFQPLELDMSPGVINCTGSTSPAIRGTVSGGVPDYRINWDGPGNNDGSFLTAPGTFTLPVITEGVYFITVTDDAGLGNNILRDTVNMVRLNRFGGTITFSDNLQCAGESAASASVNLTYGGAAVTNPDENYTFLWSNGATTQTITNVPAGQYSVTVTYSGQRLCNTPLAVASLSEPIPVSYLLDQMESPSCPTAADGSIELDVQGGTVATPDAYTVNWYLSPDGDLVSGGVGRTTLTGIGAASYFAIIEDDNGCSDTTEVFTLTDPAAIQVAFTDSVAVSCAIGRCDGEVFALASGGQPFGQFNYNFAWSSGETGNNVPNHRPNELCAGQNTVTVTDANGCSVTANVSIPIPEPVTFDSVRTTQTSCYLDNDGEAFVRATGGAGNYTYRWNNGQTGNTATNLAAGLYIVTATDANGCPSAPFNVSVAQPDSFQVSVANITPITCNGGANGTIEVQTQGGNPEMLNFQWTSGINSTTSIASQLAAGTYGVTVTDAKGCQDTARAVITQPTPVQMTLNNITPIRCNADFTLIEIDTATGGAGAPYVYTIDGFNYVSIDTPTPAYAGTYTVTVRDINDCSATREVTLSEPPPVNVSFEVDIFGLNNKTIFTSDLTGTPPVVEIDLGDSVHILLQEAGILEGVDSAVWTTAPFELGLCPNNRCNNVGFATTEDVLLNVEVTDTDGCKGEGEVLIEVNKKRRIFIPNAFNPESENFENTRFTVFGGQGVVRVKSMYVFDRWGEVVYAATDFVPDLNSEVGWDGNFNGKKMSPGIYVYAIEVEFLDGITLTYRGDVSLLK